MAKQKKKGKATLAGFVAFGVTLLLYALIFSLHKPSDFLLGGGLSLLAGWVVNTMATPLPGLDKNAKSKEKLNITIIEDEYARDMVEKGVAMLDAFRQQRDNIHESVFVHRIDALRKNLDQALRNVIDDPEEARYLRKINSYYLPTTLKMLESYRSAKAQGASYMTIAKTREDVLSMLDKLNEALTVTLDNMLKNDLEDMEIEIDVFDQMLKADGLADDDVTDALRQSAHAAAKDAPITGQPVTASARQLQQGAPVLNVPTAPAAPEYTQSNQREDIR